MIRAARSFRRGTSATIAAGLLAGASVTFACGLEDPTSISLRRGVLNLAYPASLHVGTAVWQAQLAGRLPPDPLAQRGDLTPEARGALRLVRANALLGQLALRMSGRSTSGERPNLAVVLLGPVLWTRFESGAGPVLPRVHVPGPEPGDVVLVTEIAVIEAIAGGRLGFAEALDLGVARLYGAEGEVAVARDWLVNVVPG